MARVRRASLSLGLSAMISVKGCRLVDSANWREGIFSWKKCTYLASGSCGLRCNTTAPISSIVDAPCIVATLQAISSRWYARLSFWLACSLICDLRLWLNFIPCPGPVMPSADMDPDPGRPPCTLVNTGEAMSLAALTARFVASSTRRRILSRSNRTAGSIGRGRGVL